MRRALVATLALVACALPGSPLLAATGSRAAVKAGFDNGFAGWSLAGVGDVAPTIAGGIVHSGTKSGRFLLTGSQDRSELILAGNSGSGTIEFQEGETRYFGFSFLVRAMNWGRPGAHNLITQFKSDGEGSPNFGLQLWDYRGQKGLWSHGKTMGGDRFLAPIRRHRWNDVVVHFQASRTGAGFYEVFLNGHRVDKRKRASLIRRDRSYHYIKAGLYRNGAALSGKSELRLDSVRLGTTLKQVSPP